MTVVFFRHSEFISESNMEEMLKQVQHDCWFSRYCESISESNTEESLKQVQHDRWFSRHSELVSESNMKEMLKQVQHDSIKQTSIKQTLCLMHRVCCFV